MNFWSAPAGFLFISYVLILFFLWKWMKQVSLGGFVPPFSMCRVGKCNQQVRTFCLVLSFLRCIDLGHIFKTVWMNVLQFGVVCCCSAVCFKGKASERINSNNRDCWLVAKEIIYFRGYWNKIDWFHAYYYKHVLWVRAPLPPSFRAQWSARSI